MEIAALALRFSLGWLVLTVGVSKIADGESFVGAVRRYDLIPSAVARPVAWVLLWLEVGCGLCLLGGVVPSYIAVVLTILFLVYGAAMAANLVRGHRNECGCGTSPRAVARSW